LCSVGQRVKVKVLEIDIDREKVSLTMKDGNDAGTQKIKHADFSRKKNWYMMI
jgi:ribosomal protein S1